MVFFVQKMIGTRPGARRIFGQLRLYVQRFDADFQIAECKYVDV
jgi:hypothetical protein